MPPMVLALTSLYIGYTFPWYVGTKFLYTKVGILVYRVTKAPYRLVVTLMKDRGAGTNPTIELGDMLMYLPLTEFTKTPTGLAGIVMYGQCMSQCPWLV